MSTDEIRGLMVESWWPAYTIRTTERGADFIYENSGEDE